MTQLNVTLAHARLMLLDLARTPGFVIPTVGFPAMFFGLFAMPYARTAEIADFETLSYMAFAVVGVCFYQFGVGIAAERGRPWERYLRTLPAGATSRFAARIVCAALMGLAAAACVAAIARIFTPVDFSAAQWLAAFGLALVGAVPFVLFGIALGYWVTVRAAVPIATACNLLLAYAGGLWMPPRYLPHDVQQLSPYLPTRQFAELLWSVVRGTSVLPPLAWLAFYALFFAAVASIGYRRDEKTRYA